MAVAREPVTGVEILWSEAASNLTRSPESNRHLRARRAHRVDQLGEVVWRSRSQDGKRRGRADRTAGRPTAITQQQGTR